MVKGFLKSTEGVFQLSPSLTLVGQENCDLVIQSQAAEPQHAVIEYNEGEMCFVLQDLNTAHGTYVNDCRVQNAAVRLAPGDIIKFGYAGLPHELEIEDAPVVSYPPVQQRLPGSTSLTVINNHIPISAASSQPEFPNLTYQTDPYYTANNQTQLPQIVSVSSSPQNAWGNQSLSGSNVLPRPPRPRPSSAGTRRGSGGSGDKGGFVSANSPTNSPLPPRKVTGGAWVSSVGARSVLTSQQNSTSPTSQGSPVNDLILLHEKEQKLLRMGDEINRLAVYEAESKRKDSVIAHLRDEMEKMVVDLQQNQQGMGESKMQLKVMELERDSQMKQFEINSLKEQISKMRPDSDDNGVNLRSLLNQRERELTNLKQELEKVKKERTSSNALVTNLQRDLASKDGTIKRVKGEAGLLRNQLRDREVALSAMSAKFSRVKEAKKQEEELANKTKEVVTLKSLKGIHVEVERIREQYNRREVEIITQKKKVKGLEARIAETTADNATKTEEIERLQKQVEDDKKLKGKYLSEKDVTKVQLLHSQRAEKAAKVDLDEAQKRYERFRSRVMQTTFSAPGFKIPDEDEEEISEDTIIDSMRKLLDERSESKNKVRELKDSLKALETGKKDLKVASKTLKQQLVGAEQRLEGSGRTCAHLREEIRLLQSITVDENFQGVKDTIAMMMQNELAWQQEYEKALEKCGFEIKGDRKNLSKYIEDLRTRNIAAVQEKQLVQTQMNQLESKLRAEKDKEVDKVKQKHSEKLQDELEKVQMEAETRVRSSMEEARQAERAALEASLEAERERVRHQEQSLQELRQALTEKNSEGDKQADLEKALQLQVDQLQTECQQLKEQLSMKEEIHTTTTATLEEQLAQLQDQRKKEVAAYKEQIHQHSLTIVTLEERVSQSGKSQESAQKEVRDLRKKLQDQMKETEEEVKKMREQITAASKASAKTVVVQQPNADLRALEHLISILKNENSDLKRDVQEQQDVILGLRRDLAGASARLSDMTGELSDRQKEELENNRKMLREQEAELTTQRQQLVKLSELVDNKTKEIEKLVKELDSNREASSKQKRELNAHSNELNRLKSLLAASEDEKKRALEQAQQEGLITSEMTALGAQCRGERHEQVITRQREALAELRQRIKGLESNKPPLPTHDQALQQVILLKKELAEMRAKQAQLANTSDHHRDPDVVLDREVAKARGQLSIDASDAAVERSARVEMQQAMESSEKAYISLAQKVTRLLGLGELPGLESFAHIPRDERERIGTERDNSEELIASRLSTLLQRLERKDELLKDYEKDLEKLRLAEKVANDKAAQVESLANDIRGKAEEAHYLRETLKRTRETLDQERRLNSAIKNKKTFHLENDEKLKQSWPKHKCYDEDSIKEKQKSSQQKKQQKDKMLRKNYELETIKAELRDKDQQLIETTAKLINLENAVGVPNSA